MYNKSFFDQRNFEDICRVCEKQNWREYIISKKFPEFKYKRCQNCNFMQLYPIPSNKDLSLIYSEAWAKTESGSYKYYLNDMQSTKNIKKRNLLFNEFDKINSLLNIANHKKLKVLEVGVGDGSFMSAAKAYGHDIVGVDLSDVAISRLKENGFEAILRDFCEETPELKLENFDIIHMSHTLEHFQDSNQAILKVNKLLKPGGIFWIRVPTLDEKIFSLLSKIWIGLYKLFNNWNGFYPFFWWFNFLEHISCYSANTLKRQLGNYGMKIIYEKSHLPSGSSHQPILNNIRSLLMTPFFILTKSGWEVKILSQKEKHI